MRILLFFYFITSPVYAQVFIQDIAKISYYLSEREIESYMKNPTKDGLPGIYLNALLPYSNAIGTDCIEEDAFRVKHPSYEVLLVTEEKSEIPKAAKTTVVLEKLDFTNEESNIKDAFKKVIAPKKDSPGKFGTNFSNDYNRNIIHYANPKVAVSFSSSIKTDNGVLIDLDKEENDAPEIKTDLKFDVMNRLDFSQNLYPHTTLQGSITALHSTGRNELEEIKNMTIDFSAISAEAKIKSSAEDNSKAYAAVNYKETHLKRELRVLSGLEMKIPHNAQIMVFSGYHRQHEILPVHSADKESAEVGVEYKNNDGITIFGRIRKGQDKKENVYETGVEVKIGK